MHRAHLSFSQHPPRCSHQPHPISWILFLPTWRSLLHSTPETALRYGNNGGVGRGDRLGLRQKASTGFTWIVDGLTPQPNITASLRRFPSFPPIHRGTASPPPPPRPPPPPHAAHRAGRPALFCKQASQRGLLSRSHRGQLSVM